MAQKNVREKLCHTFRNASRAAVKAYGKDTFFVLVNETEVLYSSPALHKFMSARDPAVGEDILGSIQAEASAEFGKMPWLPAYAYIFHYPQHEDIRVRFMAVNCNAQQLKQNAQFSALKAKKQNLYLFDHEWGHIYAPHGHDPRYSLNVHESVADAYAQMRHAQRFGKESTYFYATDGERADDMIIKGDFEHYTLAAIHKAYSMKYAPELPHMSMRDLLWKAGKIGLDYAMTNETHDRLSDIFKEVREDHAARQKEGRKPHLYKKTVALLEKAIRAHEDDPDVMVAVQLFADYYDGATERANMAYGLDQRVDEKRAADRREFGILSRMDRRAKNQGYARWQKPRR